MIDGLEKRTPQISPWPVIALIVAGAGSYYSLSHRLKSSRPQATKFREQPITGDEEVPSRQWQDPFETVYSYRSPAEGKTTAPRKDLQRPVPGIQEQIEMRRASEEPGSPRVLILPVMVAGAPYAEDSERRLRARYAVVTALTSMGYVPRDAQHLGYFEVPWPTAANLDEAHGKTTWCSQADRGPSPLVVPFEWFDRDSLGSWNSKKSAGSVLVLWLADESFGNEPSKRLELLRRCLFMEPPLPVCRTNVQFKLIGPGSSTVYRAMLHATPTPWLTVYSPWSTTPEPFLSRESSSDGTEQPSVPQKADGSVRVIHTDDELALLLVDELGRRGVRLTEEEEDNDVIALISESDTQYGRAMPLTFAAAINYRKYTEKVKERPKRRIPSSFLDDVIDDPEQRPDYLIQLSYLRGVDGQVPQGPDEKSPSSAEPKGSDDEQQMRRSEGRSQFDYVHRLMEELARAKPTDTEASRLPKARPKAIGILGSDVYDKLLLLQGLRKCLPGVLFFTTDLDARLLHPDDVPYTRNLIVASQYGLERVGSALPFRDTYQVAIFEACKSALENKDALTLPPPQLFEVGRRGAVDLNDRAFPKLGLPRYFMLSVFLVMFFYLLCRLAPLLREFTVGRRNLGAAEHRITTALLAGALLCAGLFGGVALTDHLRPGGEPVSLADGISIWPTEALRLLAACLALYLMVRGDYGLKLSRYRLTHDFFGKDFKPAADAFRPLSREYRHSISIRHWETEGDTVNAASVWGKYCTLGNTVNRIRRFVPCALAYLVSGFLLMYILVCLFERPHIPYRGDVSWFVDRVVLYASVILMVLLVFYVVDATRLCVRLIQHLNLGPTTWPDTLTRGVVSTEAVLSPEWLDIKMIARRTKVVGRLMLYPFYVILIMLIARTNYFDNWGSPIPIVAIVGITTAIPVLCGVSLRRAAEHARKLAIARLTQGLFTTIRDGNGDKPEGELLRLAIREINALREGAFAPFSQQPVVRALLLPTGGLGAWALLERFLLT